MAALVLSRWSSCFSRKLYMPYWSENNLRIRVTARSWLWIGFLWGYSPRVFNVARREFFCSWSKVHSISSITCKLPQPKSVALFLHLLAAISRNTPFFPVLLSGNREFMLDSFFITVLSKRCILTMISSESNDASTGCILLSLYSIAHLLLKASDLSCKKDTHGKSSTKANIDFLPPMLSVCIGPTRSMCNSSKGWQMVEMHLIGLWGLLVCFPDLHPSHAPSCLPPNLGNPLMGLKKITKIHVT